MKASGSAPAVAAAATASSSASAATAALAAKKAKIQKAVAEALSLRSGEKGSSESKKECASSSSKASSVKPCAACQNPAIFTCAECKEVYYCSKECRGSHYVIHKKTCLRSIKPYIFDPPSRVFKKAIFTVEDFQKGPDQPIDPPDTEEFEDIQHLWRYLDIS